MSASARCYRGQPAVSARAPVFKSPAMLAAVQRCRRPCPSAPAAASAAGGARRARALRRPPLVRCAAASSDDAAPEEPEALSSRDDADRLNRLLTPVKPITGEELRELVMDKWGVSYDVRIQKRGRRVYLHVMWKFLEQKSFPLTEEEYELQLQAVADYLNLWEVQERVRVGIKTANKRGPGYTGGGNAKAIQIPLDVDLDSRGGRGAEWNTF